jgi:hypothetical protein
MSKITLDGSLEQVRARFEQWRSGGSRRGRIPDDLWAAAVELARHAGVNQTAQLLHLDGGKLRRQLMAADAGESAGTVPATFVELVASRPTGSWECIIEMEPPRGGKMRIELKGVSMPELVELSRALLTLP